MSQRFFLTVKQKGYHPIVSPKNSELRFITLERIVLVDEEDHKEDSEGQEVELTILGGRCNINVSESLKWENLGSRPNVFEGRATAAYIPRETSYCVKANGSVDILKVMAPTNQKTKAFLVRPEDVKVRSVGALNWRRDVFTLIGQESPSTRLIVGETLNPPGCWSSYPPHKHDIDNPPYEAKLEEVYFFLMQPANGFGVQILYTDSGAKLSSSEAYVIRNESVVVIPGGYHPVVAAPGYRLYYFWALAGERKDFTYSDDPQHRWLKSVEPIVGILRP